MPGRSTRSLGFTSPVDTPTKRGAIVLAGIAAIVVVLLINDPIKDVVDSEISGVVERVIGDKHQIKHIVVTLPNGRKVTAQVPPACVVVPGQAVHLKSLGLDQAGEAIYFYVGEGIGSET